MSSAIYTDRRDNTHRQPAPGGGMDSRRSFLCGHKHTTGQIKSMGKGLPVLMLRCADCVAKGPKA